MVLTSGDINNVVGPNNDGGADRRRGHAGDPDLDRLTGEPTFDATVLEFDFVPNADTLFFSYVFGSEEYNEFVGSFNDVFGFFVNGQNVALIPGTNTPVSINTINNGNPAIGFPPTNPACSSTTRAAASTPKSTA